MENESQRVIAKLDCGHSVELDIMPRLQYPDDTHYIRCPNCGSDPTAWKTISSCREVNDVSDVPSGTPFIMRADILRLQPSVPPNRIRIFPYKQGKRSL